MNIKTSELVGDALDYAVNSLNPDLSPEELAFETEQDTWGRTHCPSTDYAQGGPIMDAAEIDTYLLERGSPLGWLAEITGTSFKARGPTRLIAAMRCYVASKLGDEVEVPDELCT